MKTVTTVVTSDQQYPLPSSLGWRNGDNDWLSFIEAISKATSFDIYVNDNKVGVRCPSTATSTKSLPICPAVQRSPPGNPFFSFNPVWGIRRYPYTGSLETDSMTLPQNTARYAGKRALDVVCQQQSTTTCGRPFARKRLRRGQYLYRQTDGSPARRCL